MATKKDDKPANGNPAPAETPAAKPARERAALSMEKRLAIQLSAVLSVIQRVITTKEGRAQFQAGDAAIFNAAAALADEVNQKTIKPIEDRLKELETEIGEASKPEKITADDGAKKLNDLVKELTRLQARRKTLLAQATGN